MKNEVEVSEATTRVEGETVSALHSCAAAASRRWRGEDGLTRCSCVVASCLAHRTVLSSPLLSSLLLPCSISLRTLSSIMAQSAFGDISSRR